MSRPLPRPREPNLKSIPSYAIWNCTCGAHGMEPSSVQAEKMAGTHPCTLTFPRKKIRITVEIKHAD